jgi:hypothetical protein
MECCETDRNGHEVSKKGRKEKVTLKIDVFQAVPQDQLSAGMPASLPLQTQLLIQSSQPECPVSRKQMNSLLCLSLLCMKRKVWRTFQKRKVTQTHPNRLEQINTLLQPTKYGIIDSFA